MKMIGIITPTALLVLICVAPAIAQQTPARKAAVAGLRRVSPNEMDPGFSKAAPYAQHLVDQALMRHTEILLLAIHATAPDGKNVIIASNFDRIGKLGDEDDMRCIRTGKSNLEVNPKEGHFEDELILKNKAGDTIGALGVVFAYKPGDDKGRLIEIAQETRDEMQARIPTKAKLFGSAE